MGEISHSRGNFLAVLNIGGTNYDLISVGSSRGNYGVIANTDKQTREIPSGHIGLCISRIVHKKT